MVDDSETVYISSLALLHWLGHGLMEVIGLMSGMSLPCLGTDVSVQAVDPFTSWLWLLALPRRFQHTNRWNSLYLAPLLRLINSQTLIMGHEPPQTTCNLGNLNKPSIQALIYGLNRHYYKDRVGRECVDESPQTGLDGGATDG